MNIISRIRNFIEGRPIKSDASGMFIEREDLSELMRQVGPLREAPKDDYDPRITPLVRNAESGVWQIQRGATN